MEVIQVKKAILDEMEDWQQELYGAFDMDDATYIDVGDFFEPMVELTNPHEGFLLINVDRFGYKEPVRIYWLGELEVVLKEDHDRLF